MSGVRSSCDRLSMNSVRICWRRRSSETSSSTSQTVPAGIRRPRIDSFGPSAPATATSPVDEPVERAPTAMASTPVSRKTSIKRPADQRARGTVEEDVGGRVRLGDAQAIADDQDSLRERAQEGIPLDLGRGSRRLGRERPVAQPRHGRRRVPTGRHAGLDGDPVKAAPGPQGDAGRGGRADDGPDDNDRDQPRLHRASIAQALGTVWPTLPAVSRGQAGAPAAQVGRRAGIAGATCA